MREREEKGRQGRVLECQGPHAIHVAPAPVLRPSPRFRQATRSVHATAPIRSGTVAPRQPFTHSLVVAAFPTHFCPLEQNCNGSKSGDCARAGASRRERRGHVVVLLPLRRPGPYKRRRPPATSCLLSRCSVSKHMPLMVLPTYL